MTRGAGDRLTQLRYQYFPDHLIGEILTKRWIDNAIPFLVLLIAVCVFSALVPGFLTINGLSDLGRQFAEFGLIVLGLTIVMISGGIDLSVASVYTLAVLLSLICVNVEGWPVWLSFLAVMALGVVCGSINGYLVGYLRLRAFLTTLVTLIIFRSIYDIVFLRASTAIISSLGFRRLDLHRRRNRPWRALYPCRDRRHRRRLAHRPVADAARLAAHRRRRRAAVGL